MFEVLKGEDVSIVCARTEHFAELRELLWSKYNGNNPADNQLMCEREMKTTTVMMMMEIETRQRQRNGSHTQIKS